MTQINIGFRRRNRPEMNVYIKMNSSRPRGGPMDFEMNGLQASVEAIHVSEADKPQSKVLKKFSNIAGLQLMSFNFFNQGGAVKVQQFCGFIFNPFGFLQRLQYQGFFKFGYGTVQTYAFIRYLDG